MTLTNQSVFFLIGPTASGKTSLAVKMVQTFPFEIISVDSAQIYTDMDIGVAKPSSAILKIAPHHLINIISPDQSYSVAQFKKDTLCLIEDIISRGRIPLLVGGTMMYFNALEKGINEMPTTDVSVRKKIEREAMEKGWPKLHQRLEVVDPSSAKKINPHDAQRISRALEVFYISGKSFSSFHKSDTSYKFPFTLYKLGLVPNDRKVLHANIELRVRHMVKTGLFNEVRNLIKKYPLLDSQMPSMRSVGYRQTLEFLKGEIEENECIDRIIFATRQLAKRQMTWMRSMHGLKLFDCCDENVDQKIIDYLNALLI